MPQSTWQPNHATRFHRRRSPRPSLEELDQTGISAESVAAMLVGAGDDYYHRRIKRILASGGLPLFRLERDEVHPVWVAWVRPGSAGLATDRMEAAGQLRRLLNRGGLRIKAGELSVIDRRKTMVRFTFMFRWGAAGILT